jgi:tetratricopeptide (TPR) repeat protein
MIQVITKTKYLLGALLGLSLLAQPLSAEPVENSEIEAQFKQGMQALQDDELKSAIRAFTNILDADPALNRAKLELALAYYRSLRYEEAQRLSKEVLDDPLTPPEVRVTILAFLAQVKRDSERYGQKHELGTYVQAGIMRDTNINVGPTNANIRIGDTAASLTQESLKQAATAYVLSAGADHLYQSGKRVELGERTGMLVWQSGADFYGRKYHDQGDYDIGVASLNTGPAVLMLGHWRAGLQLRSDYLTLGGHALGWFNSVNPSITWQFNNAELNWDTTYTRRFYHKDIDSQREGDYVETGLNFGRYFDNRRVAATAGAKAIKFFADSDEFGYKGFQVYAGVSTDTYKNGSAYARQRYGYYDYDGKDPTFGKAREENEYVTTLGLSHEFNEPDDLLKKWVANLFWERTENDSNIGQLYTYKRYQGMFSLSRNF